MGYHLLRLSSQIYKVWHWHRDWDTDRVQTIKSVFLYPSAKCQKRLTLSKTGTNYNSINLFLWHFCGYFRLYVENTFLPRGKERQRLHVHISLFLFSSTKNAVAGTSFWFWQICQLTCVWHNITSQSSRWETSQCSQYAVPLLLCEFTWIFFWNLWQVEWMIILLRCHILLENCRPCCSGRATRCQDLLVTAQHFIPFFLTPHILRHCPAFLIVSHVYWSQHTHTWIKKRCRSMDESFLKPKAWRK